MSCSVPDCGQPAKTRGLCLRHYKRLLRHGDPTKGRALNGLYVHCTIEGCAHPVQARGLCNVHFNRWKRLGDAHAPVRKRTTDGDPARFVLETALSWANDDCLLWPFGLRGGYGSVGRRRAHEIVCEMVHGVRPLGKPYAAHWCGNARCVNPLHIRWATPKENAADARRHRAHAEFKE